MNKTADAIAKMTADKSVDGWTLKIEDNMVWACKPPVQLYVADVVGPVADPMAGAVQVPKYPQNRTMGSVRKVPQVIHYWNGMVFFGGRQRKAFVAAHSRADAARVLLECGIHNCSQRYIKEFFSECWGSSEQRELPQDVRGVWVQVDRHRYQQLEVKP